MSTIFSVIRYQLLREVINASNVRYIPVNILKQFPGSELFIATSFPVIPAIVLYLAVLLPT